MILRAAPRRRPGLLRRALRTTDGRVGAALLLFVVALSLLAPAFLPSPDHSDFGAAAAADGGPPTPSLAHPLGTDSLFRDVLARLGAGGRVSLLIGAVGAGVATVVGLLVGVGAATARRAGARSVDTLLMRLVDVLLALPFLLFVTTVGTLVGRTDATTLVFVLGLTGWTGLARVVRARAERVLSEDFVLASRAFGGGITHIAWRHVLPNVAEVAIVLATSLAASMILAEAVLGYLAVGIQPPQATWGRMLHEAETLVVLRPLLVAAPGACIVLTMLGLHRLGEALRAASEVDREVPSAGRFPLDVAIACAALGLLVALPARQLAPPADVAGGEAPVRGGTLRVATAYTVRTMDPATAPDEMSIALARLVFGRLITFDAAGRHAPALVERFEWGEGATSMRLYLRPGVRFQDGAVLGAADVKRSIERALDPKAASPGASNFANLLGYDAFRSGAASGIEGVEVESDLVVRIRLREPDTTLPSLLTLSFLAPVCPSTPASVKDTTEASLCGAGPFRIDRFEPERSVRLVRHDAYYEPGLPYLDAIELSLAVRPQTQRFLFERAELDLVRELSGADGALVRADPRWAPFGRFVESLRSNAIFLNTELPPFDDARVRRAVSLAVDPSVLSKVRADLLPLSRVVPAAVPGRRAPAIERVHDLEAALAAMAEAGYAYDPSTGHGGYPEPIDYVTVPDTFEQSAAEIYQQQLARVGLRVRLRLLNHQTYLSEVQRRGRSTMGWAGWQADYPDALTFFDPKLVSSAIGPVSQNNSFYADAELDAVIARVRREPDPDARDALFSRAEEIVHEDAAWIPVTTTRVFELRQPWLMGYAGTPLEQLDFAGTWLRPSRPGAGGGARVLGLAHLIGVGR